MLKDNATSKSVALDFALLLLLLIQYNFTNSLHPGGAICTSYNGISSVALVIHQNGNKKIEYPAASLTIKATSKFAMLSFGKSLATFPCQLPRAFQYRGVKPSLVIRNSSEDGSNVDGDSNSNTSPLVQPPVTPPRTVEVRFKRGSRRRKKQEQEGNASNISSIPKVPPKEWDSMTLTEKATELYVGEKGLLFWLNKFAYASIFIVIGGWIVFRFVGPALNWYQLDTPPLAPTSLFKD